MTRLTENIEVPKLCVGLDWKGHSDIGLGKSILIEACQKGYNFCDTADNYTTQSHVRLALKEIPREKIIISTKISSEDYDSAKDDVQKCLEELGTDYIDILLLHGLDSVSDFKDCGGAWDYLREAKERGAVKAIGASTHAPEMVNFLADSDADVILTAINKKGDHIRGDLQKQIEAIKKAAKNGKGLLAMKILGEGQPELLKNVPASIKYAADLPFHSLAIGIRSLEDLREDIRIIESL